MSNSGTKYDQGKPMLSIIAPELWEVVLYELGYDPEEGLGRAIMHCNRAAHAPSSAMVVAYLRSAAASLIDVFGIMSCMTEAAVAMQFGCKKYGRDNWKGGLQALRLLDAIHRHLLAAAAGQDTDEESGAKHYGCALFGIQCILHYDATAMDVWDDYPWATKKAKRDTKQSEVED